MKLESWFLNTTVTQANTPRWKGDGRGEGGESREKRADEMVVKSNVSFCRHGHTSGKMDLQGSESQIP